ncbi:unnamed protein product [Heterobilharzia americana]|nr:unnamed protein product [Heterobilharzia americana]
MTTCENSSLHQITATEQPSNISTDFIFLEKTTSSNATMMTTTSENTLDEQYANSLDSVETVREIVSTDLSDGHSTRTTVTEVMFNQSKCNNNMNRCVTTATSNTTATGEKMVTFCNSINSHMLSSDSFVDTTANEDRCNSSSCNHMGRKFGLADYLTKQRLIDQLLNCFRPFIYLVQKEKSFQSTDQDLPWEVPFESVTDLVWIGSGAQGVVFRGYFRGELIAVKKVNKQSDTDIRHLRYLNHPNIIKFRGVCVEQPCYCILMEYCPYGQLYELIHSGNPISPSLIYSWIKQIADGMHYLHSCKIIHRDLKSPNVLVGYDHVLKISDFGASREWTENSTKMSFTGTVAWMAPEIIRNEPCSFKVDVWSYGVLLWELLTGEIPYHNVDSTAILWGVGSEHLRLPVPMTCPSELRALMKTCWNIKPGNRPSFRQILSHLNVTCSSLLQYTDDEFNSLRQLWKEEIAIYLQDIRLEGQSTPKLELMLIRRRREELCHAQDIRRCYEDKRERANELCLELQKLLIECEEEKRKAERERLYYETLIQELSTSQQEQHKHMIGAKESREEEKSKQSDYDNHHNAVMTVTTNFNSSSRKQFPFSTLSTFSLGRKLNDFYFRRRNNHLHHHHHHQNKPTTQSLSLPINNSNTPVHTAIITTTTVAASTTTTTNKANISSRSVLGSMELLRNPYTLLSPYNKNNYYRSMLRNDILTALINNNHNNRNTKSVCAFCGSIYSDTDRLLTSSSNHHRRALTMSMLEYELLAKLDLDKTACSLVHDELTDSWLSNSLTRSTRKQFASTNSLHYLVPPPPPAYDSIMKNDPIKNCYISPKHSVHHQYSPPASIAITPATSITTACNTTYVNVCKERDNCKSPSHQYYHQIKLTDDNHHCPVTAFIKSSSSSPSSLSPAMMSVNDGIKNTIASTVTITTANANTNKQ